MCSWAPAPVCYTMYNALYSDSNDVSCTWLCDPKDEPFPSRRKEILLLALRDSKQRARKVKDFIDLTMITKIRSPQE